MKTSYSTPFLNAFDFSDTPESMMLDQCRPFGVDLHKKQNILLLNRLKLSIISLIFTN